MGIRHGGVDGYWGVELLGYCLGGNRQQALGNRRGGVGSYWVIGVFVWEGMGIGHKA